MSTPPINVTQQRSLSIYTLIGALQSILWFFYLPTISKAYWSQLFGRYTNQQAEIILWAIGFPFFLLYILVAALPSYFLFCDWEFIQQYKISKDPWPWAIVANNNIGRSIRSKISDNDKQQFLRRTYKSILSDFAGLLVFIPSLVSFKTILLPHLEMSFSTSDFPTPSIESASTLLAMGIIHEFGFYWTHRLMHTYPSLYQYHKVHHEYHQNNVLAAEYFHPIDFLISIAFPAMFTTMIVRPHGFTQFQFGLWLLTANFDDHLGYAFPWSACRWFPLSAGTDAHEFHHSVNMGCYGSKLCIWDWLFGTDKVYEKWRRKRWGLVG